MIPIAGGTVRLGRRRGEGFGWDNEFEAHEEAVGPFSAARFKASTARSTGGSTGLCAISRASRHDCSRW